MLMPTVSIRQPWAAMIVLGRKDVENRTWRFPAHLTGKRVLVHATMKPDPSFPVDHQYYDAKPEHPEAYRTGGIVGSIILDGHTRNSGSRWAFPGHFHWLLSDPRGLPFFACKGRLGFFSVDYPYEEAIHA